jgi:GNAT superfamily N-acetyltransferase
MVIVRKAAVRDIPRILELYEELTENKQDISPAKAKQILRQINAISEGRLLVAEQDGMVLGTLYIQVIPNLSHNGTPYAVIENVVVDKRFHKQGIGRLLIENALTFAREAGCYKVQLLSMKKRLDAHQFYRAFGFEDSALGFRLYFNKD